MRASLAAALLCWGSQARADMFSPGDLAQGHANLEGLKNCTKCHVAGQQLAPETCLDCHTELKTRVAEKKGFHGHLDLGKDPCQTCHLDHQGRDFALVDWGKAGKKGFDHGKTGWVLKGGHAKVECAKCHDPRRIDDAEIKRLLEKNPKRETYLGLRTACATCHFEEHRGQLGTACEKCHEEKAWKPAPGFDHSRADFALEGAHRKVECAKCHKDKTDSTPPPAFPPARAATFAQFSDLKFAACTDCHTDPHEGRFGAKCLSCHSNEAWKPVKSSGDRAFHEKTAFPLRGAHATVDCAACHGAAMKTKGLAFGACTDCHADAHLGQLGTTTTQLDCTRCHTEVTFKPSRFGLREHASTAYPLEGKHRDVACATCHATDPALDRKIPDAVRAQLKKAKRPEHFSLMKLDLPEYKDGCLGCHADAHAGQLGTGVPLQCDRCHAVTGFAPARFEIEDHARSKYPLTGAHQAVACRACHAEDRTLARAGVALLSLAVLHPKAATDRCESCHKDPHDHQFDTWGPRGGCAACHRTTDFLDVSFDHAKNSRFALTGKHAKATCNACHFAATANAVVRFRPLDPSCRTCHADPHAGQFDAPSQPADCATCHETADFKDISRFTHRPPMTDFTLDGKHANVACAKCHTSVALADAKPIQRFKATPRDCENCHVDQHDGAFQAFESILKGGAR